MDHAIVLLKGCGSLVDASRKNTKIETKIVSKESMMERKVFFKSRKYVLWHQASDAFTRTYDSMLTVEISLQSHLSQVNKYIFSIVLSLMKKQSGLLQYFGSCFLEENRNECRPKYRRWFHLGVILREGCAQESLFHLILWGLCGGSFHVASAVCGGRKM